MTKIGVRFDDNYSVFLGEDRNEFFSSSEAYVGSTYDHTFLSAGEIEADIVWKWRARMATRAITSREGRRQIRLNVDEEQKKKPLRARLFGAAEEENSNARHGSAKWGWHLLI